MDQLPRLGKRELIRLLLFTCRCVVSVRRGFLFLWVLGIGCVILLWHSLSLLYNYIIWFTGVGIEEEGRKYLTIKTLRPFRYVYKHYFNDFDWFLKTDDDAYVIMENLRYFLSAQDTNKPIYFGHKFKTYIKSGWFSGGPGIVLSKEALRRFGEAGLEVCPEPVTAAGDLNLGRCMEKISK